MRRRGRDGTGPRRVAGRGHEWVEGRNAALEVLRGGRRQVYRLWVAPGVRRTGTAAEILSLAEARHIPIDREPAGGARAEADAAHGVGVEVDPYPYVGLEDLLSAAEERGEPPLLLLLDELQDPQNLGTLLRTAEAVGAHGVVLPYRRSVGITAAVVRASSGATEHLWIAAENLAQAIERLREMGVRVVGLEAGSASVPIGHLDLSGPLALVVGSEGEGMRRLVRERCEVVAGLPVEGRVGSLNAAVAGSIALYLAWSARRRTPSRIDAPGES